MTTKSYWQQFERQRISRRRLLAVSGAGAAGLAVVAACSNKKKSTSAGTTPAGTALGTPKSGGVYQQYVPGDWLTIDPLTSVGYGPELQAKMYNGLVLRSSRKPDQFYLDLAESYEQPEPGTYNFKIRPGVKIAPNDLGIPQRDMDAMDCQRWLEATVAAPTAVAKRWTNIWLDSFSAISATEFQIKTKGPYAYFFNTLNVPVGGMIPPRELFEQNIDMKAQGVGAGPYVLRPGTFVETGGATLDRNPNYYRKDDKNNNAQLPYIDGVERSRFSDRQPRRTAFIGKQIHVYDPETRNEVDDLKGQISDLEVFEDPAFTFVAFTMNPTKAPWDNDKVRMAANFALNRQQFVDVILNGDGKPDGLVHWPLGDYALSPDELKTLQPFDPEKSKQLIQAAGHSLPLKIKVMYPIFEQQFHSKTLPIWRTQMQAAGFELDEEPLDLGTWYGRYQKVDYDSSLSPNQVYETPEINLDFHGSKGPTNDGAFAIGIGKLYPEVDDAIQASKSTVVVKDQVQRVLDTQRLIYSKGPAFLPIMTWIDFFVRHSLVKNWPQGYGTAFDYTLEQYAWLNS
jgi:ABC-type transport system substrate-binding protein